MCLIVFVLFLLSVHLKGLLEDKVFEDRDVSFCLGEGLANGVSTFYKNNISNTWHTYWTPIESKSIYQSIQFWSGFIPVNGGGQIYCTLTAISPTHTLHLARFMTSSFSKPTFLLSFSTCIFHVFFDRPRFLLPFTSNSNAFVMPIIPPQHMPVHTISLHSALPSERWYGI